MRASGRWTWERFHRWRLRVQKFTFWPPLPKPVVYGQVMNADEISRLRVAMRLHCEYVRADNRGVLVRVSKLGSRAFEQAPQFSRYLWAQCGDYRGTVFATTTAVLWLLSSTPPYWRYRLRTARA